MPSRPAEVFRCHWQIWSLPPLALTNSPSSCCYTHTIPNNPNTWVSCQYCEVKLSKYFISVSWLFLQNLTVLADCLICLVCWAGPACCPDTVVKVCGHSTVTFWNRLLLPCYRHEAVELFLYKREIWSLPILLIQCNRPHEMPVARMVFIRSLTYTFSEEFYF